MPAPCARLMLAVDAMSARHCQTPGFLMAEPDNAAEILRRATSRRTRTGAANAIDAVLVKRAANLMGSLEGSHQIGSSLHEHCIYCISGPGSCPTGGGPA